MFSQLLKREIGVSSSVTNIIEVGMMLGKLNSSITLHPELSIHKGDIQGYRVFCCSAA
jgi:hypothetical protein